MRCFLLFFVVVTFLPIATISANAGIVFSWVDAKGVMHFTDKKPTEIEVESDKLITKEVEVTNILESETVTSKNTPPKQIQEILFEEKEEMNDSQNQDQSSNVIKPELDINEASVESVADFEDLNIDKQPVAILELSNKTP